MNKFRLNIDGKEVFGIPGQTILEVARENDIEIPTLCYDERTEIYGACGLCVVEVEGNPKLCKACATQIAPNMIVNTKSSSPERRTWSCCSLTTEEIAVLRANWHVRPEQTVRAMWG